MVCQGCNCDDEVLVFATCAEWLCPVCLAEYEQSKARQ